MKKPKIILLCGNPGCGKTTIAKELEKLFNYRRLSFAQPVRDVAKILIGNENAREDDKESIIEGFDISYRDVLKRVGMFGRREIKETLWVDILLRRMDGLADDHPGFVIDDCRFHNECYTLRSRGAAVVRVRCDQVDAMPRSGHASEKEWPLWTPNLTVDNHDWDTPGKAADIARLIFEQFGGESTLLY